MKKILKRTLLFVSMMILAWGIGAFAGKEIYQMRYFSSLPPYEGPVLTKDGPCKLCNCSEVNPPCIVNLITGDVSAIHLYNTESTVPKRIDGDKTEEGIAKSGGASGTYYFSVPDEHYSDISIRRDCLFQYSAEIAGQLFCKNCIEMIEPLKPDSNILFADCYDSKNIRFYKLEDAEKGITVRHYSIIIEDKGEVYLRMKMTSSYFTDNGNELNY